jgi:hypothetical protein
VASQLSEGQDKAAVSGEMAFHSTMRIPGVVEIQANLHTIRSQLRGYIRLGLYNV